MSPLSSGSVDVRVEGDARVKADTLEAERARQRKAHPLDAETKRTAELLAGRISASGAASPDEFLLHTLAAVSSDPSVLAPRCAALRR